MIPGLSATALSLLLALVLGLSPLGPRIVEWVARPLGGTWYWQVLLGGLALLVLGRLVTLPFGAWAEHVRRDNGLSTRQWSGWALDVAKGFGVASVLTLGALFAIVALARKWPSGWWAPASLGAAVLVVAVSFLYPLVVEPLFNLVHSDA